MASDTSVKFDTFNAGLVILREFALVNSRMPYSNEIYEDVPIGKWFHDQLRARRDKQISITQWEKLQKIPYFRHKPFGTIERINLIHNLIINKKQVSLKNKIWLHGKLLKKHAHILPNNKLSALDRTIIPLGITPGTLIEDITRISLRNEILSCYSVFSAKPSPDLVKILESLATRAIADKYLMTPEQYEMFEQIPGWTWDHPFITSAAPTAAPTEPKQIVSDEPTQIVSDEPTQIVSAVPTQIASAVPKQIVSAVPKQIVSAVPATTVVPSAAKQIVSAVPATTVVPSAAKQIVSAVPATTVVPSAAKQIRKRPRSASPHPAPHTIMTDLTQEMNGLRAKWLKKYEACNTYCKQIKKWHNLTILDFLPNQVFEHVNVGKWLLKQFDDYIWNFPDSDNHNVKLLRKLDIKINNINLFAINDLDDEDLIKCADYPHYELIDFIQIVNYYNDHEYLPSCRGPYCDAYFNPIHFRISNPVGVLRKKITKQKRNKPIYKIVQYLWNSAPFPDL
jgi:hypothetical protein